LVPVIVAVRWMLNVQQPSAGCLFRNETDGAAHAVARPTTAPFTFVV
jgi:hypothetical protein